ncbi:MAG: hypothetical protein SGCHY_001445, partial [Lobulomycetales sp.]
MFRRPLSLRFKHTLPDLPYDFNALEPFISAEIMMLHHSKHHAAYVANLNIAEEKLDANRDNLTTKIQLQQALKFNGGGHINHSIFWQNLAPPTGQEPSGSLLAAITRDFGTFEAFKTVFANAAAGVQGSGWAWLGFNPTTKKLEIVALPNQDPLT